MTIKTAQVAECSDSNDVDNTALLVQPGTFLVDVSTWTLYVAGDDGVAVPIGTAPGNATTSTRGLVLRGAGVASMTDSTGGAVSTTLAAIVAGASYAQADMVATKNGLASLNAHVAAIYTSLQNAGVIMGPPS